MGVDVDDSTGSQELSQALLTASGQPVNIESRSIQRQAPGEASVPAPRLAPIREDDLERMRARFYELLGEEGTQVRESGQELFKRIASVNWSVEWNLPRWLAAGTALTEADVQHLVAANVFGLGYVRMYDDRRDGEASSMSRLAGRRLEASLLGAAEGEYSLLLGEETWFWDRFHGHLLRWKQAMKLSHFRFSADDPASSIQAGLADIGAPLLIVCAAVCGLSGDLSRLELLEAPIRHYLASAVLYDHLKDWPEDIAAGRPNVFVRWMLAPGGGEWNAAGTPGALDAAFSGLEHVAGYVNLLLDQLELAARCALDAGLQGFAGHLAGLKVEASSSASETLGKTDSLLRLAKSKSLVET